MNLSDVQEMDLKCKQIPYVTVHLATDVSKWVLYPGDSSFSSLCVHAHFVVINFSSAFKF